VRRPLAGLGPAVTFLTIVPVRLREPLPALGAAAAWFPVVGAAVGALAGGIDYVLVPSLGPLVAAVLAVAVLVLVTGALHQDGLADCADGLGVRGDRARRLAVMRDPAVGSFGVLALGLWLVLMIAALAGFARDDAWRALIAAAAVGRWAALLHAAAAPPARADGLGAGFVVPPAAVVVATVPASLAAVVAGLGGGVAALASALVVAGLVTRWSRVNLGGRTGDTLGATVALTEAAALTVLLGLS
jgi:adenosylcobinamide-GDP ribazoletransferase